MEGNMATWKWYRKRVPTPGDRDYYRRGWGNFWAGTRSRYNRHGSLTVRQYKTLLAVALIIILFLILAPRTRDGYINWSALGFKGFKPASMVVHGSFLFTVDQRTKLC